MMQSQIVSSHIVTAAVKKGLKYSDSNALLKASSLYSSRTRKGSRFQRSGAALGKLAYPALHFRFDLLSCDEVWYALPT